MQLGIINSPYTKTDLITYKKQTKPNKQKKKEKKKQPEKYPQTNQSTKKIEKLFKSLDFLEL